MLSEPNRSLYKHFKPTHDQPCVLYQPHTMGVMELYRGGEGIEELHCGLHSDYIGSQESPVDPGGPVVIIFATGSEVRRFKPGRN